MQLITCKNLTLGYGKVKIIENISFSVNEGDYLCIVGENGSGKSTLLKTCLGLLSPLAGEIIYSSGISADRTGYLPQQNSIQKDFPASCREIVLSGCLNKCGFSPFYGNSEKQLAETNMKRLNIKHLSDKSFRELSGGQQQRVLLARALCAAEKILFMDEPVAGLDPIAEAEMYKLVRELNRDGITVIMITHDISAAINNATHIMMLRERKAYWGTRQEFLERDTLSCLSPAASGKHRCQ